MLALKIECAHLWKLGMYPAITVRPVYGTWSSVPQIMLTSRNGAGSLWATLVVAKSDMAAWMMRDPGGAAAQELRCPGWVQYLAALAALSL